MMMAGEKPIEERRPGASNVQVSGRAWCKSCNDHKRAGSPEVLVIIKETSPFINPNFPIDPKAPNLTRSLAWSTDS